MERVPTPEEMQNWFPDPAPEKRRFAIVVNVTTGERTEVELTLEEYRQRHVNKIISRNRREARAIEDARKARRQAALDRLIDAALEAEDANPATR
jgi:hypothetical protein